jgi:hypothetical protein
MEHPLREEGRVPASVPVDRSHPVPRRLDVERPERR